LLVVALSSLPQLLYVEIFKILQFSTFTSSCQADTHIGMLQPLLLVL
jgi:hypothetical protein